MGITGFTKSLPTTSNSNNCLKILPLCGSVSNAPFPRKQRSAVKKRAKYGTATRRKNGAKKLQVKMEQGQITKDEEEVAEALYALANMFADVNNDNKRALADGMLTSDAAGGNELNKNLPEVNPRPGSDLPSEKQTACSDASEMQSLLISDSRQNIRKEMTPTEAQSSLQKQVLFKEHASDVQIVAPGPGNHEHSYTTGVRNNGLLKSSSLTETEMPPSLRLSSLFNNTDRLHLDDRGPGSRMVDPVKSKKSIKRCSTHVYVCHLIKVLKLTTKENSSEIPIRLTISREPQASLFSPSRETHQLNHSASEKNILAERKQLVSETSSSRHGYDFLSRSTMACEPDTHDADKGAQCQQEDGKTFGAQCMQSQSQCLPFLAPKMVFSSTSHGNGFALATQHLQEPQYLRSSSSRSRSICNNSFPTKNQFIPPPEKWVVPQLPIQYNGSGGVIAAKISEWQNGTRSAPSAMLSSYAQTLLPHLYPTTTLGSKSHPGNNNWPVMFADANRDHCPTLRNGATTILCHETRPHLRLPL